MTTVVDRAAGTRQSPRRTWITSGWLPALAGYLAVAALLVWSGVRVSDIAVFSAYVVGCVTVPGTLAWRFVRSDRSRPFVADVVLGTGLGYAIEVMTYLPARAIGIPLLVLAWPVLVIGLSLRPAWRHVWRSANTCRQSAGWSWGMTGLVLLAFAWIAHNLWWPSPITREGVRFPYVDEPYHLSLVAELRHHLPVSSPVVQGEPLYYHWFVHADVAASSWITGIEPVVLLQILTFVPMITVILVGAAVLAGELAKSASIGLLAPAMLVVAGGGVGFQAGEAFLTAVLYLSPTTTFAQMLLVPTAAVALSLLGHDPGRPVRRWIVMALLLATVSGAKATVLPIVGAGFLAVLIMGLLVHRRLHRRALILFGMSVVTMLAAIVLVFGGQSRGMGWGTFELAEVQAVDAGLAANADSVGLGLAALLTVTYLATQLSFAAGLIGIARNGTWRDPRAQFLVGGALAGTGATFAFSAQGLSQAYFFRTTPLLFAVAATWGFAQLLPARRGRALTVSLWVAAGGGLALAAAVRSLESAGVIGVSARATAAGVLEPYLIVAVVLGAAGLLIGILARFRPAWRGTVAALVVAASFGLGLQATVSLLSDLVREPVPAAYSTPTDRQATIGLGGVAAARWLRAHSEPDDLVATNAHCLPSGRSRCNNKMFWLSAFSERHILVEGWSYQVRTNPTARRLGVSSCCLPFWHPELLRMNDAAFMGDRRAVETLRARHGVDWMVVDKRSPHDVEQLARLAKVRFRAGEYVVLELR